MAPLLTLLLACGEELALTATISADGGSIDLPGGGGLDIPAGALTSDVEIGVELVADPTAAGWQAMFEGAEDSLASLALTPHGLEFAEPVTLRIPAPDYKPGMAVLKATTPYSSDWEAVGPLRFEDGIVSVDIDSFSEVSLTSIANGACPCFDSKDVVTFFEVGRAAGYPETLEEDVQHDYVLATFKDPSDVWVKMMVTAYDHGHYCQAQALAADHAALFARFWPDLKITQADTQGGWGWSSRDTGEPNTLTAAQKGACEALIRAGAGGTLAASTRIVTAGLPSGVGLTLKETRAGTLFPVTGHHASGPPLALGADYALSIETQPAGATCVLDATTASGTAPADPDDELVIYVACIPNSALPSTPPEEAWGYSPGDEYPPSLWSELDLADNECGDDAQSPIDILLGDVVEGTGPAVAFAYGDSSFDIENTGHAFRWNIEPGSTLTVDGTAYELTQFHVHGGSEHRIEGLQLPLELHLVHESDAGALAVFGLFFEEGVADNPLLDSLGWGELAGLPIEGDVYSDGSTINLAAMVEGHTSGALLHYTGSLTTPPCTEDVAWFLSGYFLEASPAQIQAYTDLYGANYRPPQSVNGRELINFVP